MRMLVLRNEQLITTLHAVDGTLTIGSSPTCFVHVEDSRVSAHQASIHRDLEGHWWLDIQDSLRPTCLNRAVQKGKARLNHADEIELGDYCIRLFLDQEFGKSEFQRKRIQDLSRSHTDMLPADTLLVRDESDLRLCKVHLAQMTGLAMRLEQVAAPDEIMAPTLQTALVAFHGRRAWMGLRRGEHGDFDWSLGWSVKGAPCPMPPFAHNMEGRCMTAGHSVCAPQTPVDGVGSAMAAPIIVDKTRAGMLYVENDPGDTPYDETALHGLTGLALCVSLPFAETLRKNNVKRQSVLDQELTLARMIQDAITPPALPQWEHMHLAAFRQPGTRHCSDLFDVIQLRDKSAAILLGRLTASAIELPRLLSEVRSAFRMAVLHSDTPMQFMRALNWLVPTGGTDRYVDAACVWLNPVSGVVRYCRAGTRVLLGSIHGNGTCDEVGIEPAISSASPAIGRDRDATYPMSDLALGPGDALVMATDGAATATNRAGEIFGMEALKDNLCDGLGDTPGHVLSEFATDLREFVREGDCPDDVTVLLAQRR